MSTRPARHARARSPPATCRTSRPGRPRSSIAVAAKRLSTRCVPLPMRSTWPVMALVRSEARQRDSCDPTRLRDHAVEPLAEVAGEAHLQRAVGHRLPAADPGIAGDHHDVEHQHGEQVQRHAESAKGGRHRAGDATDAALLDVDADEAAATAPGRAARCPRSRRRATVSTTANASRPRHRVGERADVEDERPLRRPGFDRRRRRLR